MHIKILIDTVDEPTAADPPRIFKYDTLPGDILHIEPLRAQRLNGWLKTWTLVEVMVINMKNNKQIYWKLKYTFIIYIDIFC